MPSAYTPKPDSLANRVIFHLQRHPELEGMTLSDMTDLFDVTRGNIHTQLGLCIEHKLLKREQNDDTEYVYQRGKEFPFLGWPADQAATKAASAKPSKAPTSRRLPQPPLAIDPATVPVEDGVPLPGGRDNRMDYTALFSRMGVNQSASLPLRARGTLQKQISEVHKAGAARFTVRAMDSDTLRVWRVA